MSNLSIIPIGRLVTTVSSGTTLGSAFERFALWPDLSPSTIGPLLEDSGVYSALYQTNNHLGLRYLAARGELEAAMHGKDYAKTKRALRELAQVFNSLGRQWRDFQSRLKPRLNPHGLFEPRERATARLKAAIAPLSPIVWLQEPLTNRANSSIPTMALLAFARKLDHPEFSPKAKILVLLNILRNEAPDFLFTHMGHFDQTSPSAFFESLGECWKALKAQSRRLEAQRREDSITQLLGFRPVIDAFETLLEWARGLFPQEGKAFASPMDRSLALMRQQIASARRAWNRREDVNEVAVAAQ